MTENIKTKADELYDLQIFTIKAESELGDLLDSLSRPFSWSDFSYDYYDYSLEVYGVSDSYKLCGEDAIKLKKYGFHQVWTHTVNNKNEYTNKSRPARQKEGERFYRL
jgi:hypothetical protein